MSYFQASMILLGVSTVITYIGSFMKKAHDHMNQIVPESRVREIINERLQIVHSDSNATKDRLERVEDTLVRVEEKIDRILLKQFGRDEND